MVDEAAPFPDVLQRVVAWLQERELGTKYKYAILTDGYVLKSSDAAQSVPPLVSGVKSSTTLVVLGPGT